MTNIQPNEYVRTKDGYISKVKEVTDDWIECESTITKHYEDTFDSLYPDEFGTITNHSFNIIDLIEAGDYVKLYEKLGNKEYIDEASSYVSNTGTIDGKRFIELDYGQDGTEYFYDTNKIETIATKEQFKAMEYKVGGEDD